MGLDLNVEKHSPRNYPIRWRTVVGIAASTMTGRKRSFASDARRFTSALRPPLNVEGVEYAPFEGPGLITINHYHRPGFPSWWLAFSVSSVIPAEVHWVMTREWTGGGIKGQVVTPATRRIFARLACVYGFSTMPPMPPVQQDNAARADAVRRVLRYAKQASRPLIGFAPEGADALDGSLQTPPKGIGRFVLHLAEIGLPLYPAGIFEEGNQLCLRFGRPYQVQTIPGGKREDRDRDAARLVMQRIAELLPAELRGEFG